MRKTVLDKELFSTRTVTEGACPLANVTPPYEPRGGVNEISFHFLSPFEMILSSGREIETTNTPFDEVPVELVFSLEPLLFFECLGSYSLLFRTLLIGSGRQDH
jgi:hypothetical protein